MNLVRHATSQSFKPAGAEIVAALVNGALMLARLPHLPITERSRKVSRYLLYGPDLQIPYSAANIVTRRATMAKRPLVGMQFMQVIAEAANILHTNKEFSYRVLAKYLSVSDTTILDAAYSTEIKVMERRLEIKPEGLQAILEEVVKTDPRAKTVKPTDLIDRRYLDEMAKNGFFDKLWASK
jgi:hypothetical protein